MLALFSACDFDFLIRHRRQVESSEFNSALRSIYAGYRPKSLKFFQLYVITKNLS